MTTMLHLCSCLFFFLVGTLPCHASLDGSNRGSKNTRIVSIPYQELADAFSASTTNSEECTAPESSRLPPPPRLLAAIAEAFGPEGLGLVEISNIPDDLVRLRQTVLPLAAELATLPQEELRALERPEDGYNLGWSHGKEQFGLDPTTGQPIYDTFKGSFYLDPFRQEIPNHNVFPNTALPSLKDPLLEVTQWMTQVALWIAQLCDAYLEKAADSMDDNGRVPSESILYNSLQTKVNTKARLLYYFPKKNQQDSQQTTLSSSKDDDWCGWHKDHGSLTVLLPGMMLEGNVEAPTGSGGGGLYIQRRDQQEVLVRIPPTSIAVQVGETVEIQSGGLLQATPHAVKSTPRFGIGRASLAVFVEPELHQPLPECPLTADASLQSRHRATFGAFQEATLQAFQ